MAISSAPVTSGSIPTPLPRTAGIRRAVVPAGRAGWGRTRSRSDHNVLAHPQDQRPGCVPAFITSSNFLLSRTLTSRAPVGERATAAPSFFPRPSITRGAARSALRWISLGPAQVWGDSSGVGQTLAELRPLDVQHPASPDLDLRSHRVRPRLELSCSASAGCDDFLDPGRHQRHRRLRRPGRHV